jgi:peroxiredoxin
VLFDHGEGLGEASLELLFARPPAELKEGAAWTQGSLEFRVAEAREIDGRETWRVEVRSPTGPKGDLFLDRENGFPIAVTERMTLGQGKPHAARLKLKSAETISQEAIDKAAAAFEHWVALRDELKLEPDAREYAWTEEQLAVLKDKLPGAVAAAAETPLAALAAEAEEDLRLQSGRSGRVAALRTKLIDRPAPNFELQTMRGEKVTNADLKGAVAVLHFWEYRDMPLEEPYGQVGYLDFLFRKHEGAGLKVYGVNVDERLADPGARTQSISSARKLHSFMNLSYPVLLDDGSMLKRFGDPRSAGGKLPLFVVIGADGKVLHYHAGFHEVDRDLGLKVLDQAAASALK